MPLNYLEIASTKCHKWLLDQILIITYKNTIFASQETYPMIQSTDCLEINNNIINDILLQQL